MVPTLQDKETGLVYDPIAVVPSTRDAKLGPMSRVNFATIQTIQHNVKVKDIGIVQQSDIPKLVEYFLRELDRSKPSCTVQRTGEMVR